MNASWIIPTAFSILGAIISTVVGMYLKGIAGDIAEMRKRAELMETNWQTKLDVAVNNMRVQSEKQAEQLTQVRVEVAKIQEQLYAILRGGVASIGRSSSQGGP